MDCSVGCDLPEPADRYGAKHGGQAESVGDTSATGPTGGAAALHHNGESKWKELKKELVASFNSVAKTTGVLVVAHNKGLL